MRLAIIPARSGSKRIPRKNIRQFGGIPMIGHAISAARASAIFDHVIVSTDDDEIADLALELGAEVPFLRPPELADDFTPTVPVIAHAVRACEELGWVAAYVCCIYPAVPLIETVDLTLALELLRMDADTSYAFPVASFSSAIQRALRRLDDGTTSAFFPQYEQTRTQDLEPAFYDAGQFYWGRRNAWLSGQSIHANARTIVLPDSRVVDIDTEEDWIRAELLYHQLRKGKS